MFGHFNSLKGESDQLQAALASIAQLSTDVQRLMREQPPVSGNGGGISDAGNDMFGGPRDGRLIVCKLKGPLYRTISVNSDVLEWNGSAFADSGRDVTIYGDLMRGYHFTDTTIRAFRLPNARYFAETNGIPWIEGTLDGTLAVGLTATLSVFNESTDTGYDVIVHASKLMTVGVDAGTWINASWHEANQHWRISGKGGCD